jgi:hypothetical protein
MIPVSPGIISSNLLTRKDGTGAFHSTNKTSNITGKSAGYLATKQTQQTQTRATEKFASMEPSLDFLSLQKHDLIPKNDIPHGLLQLYS